MKIIDFVKKNKVPTIATSVVLVAAIAVGVTFGVMKHKDNVEVKPSEVETSSAESSSEVSASTVEDSSSEAEASSEDSTSSVVSETEPVSSAQTSSQALVSSAAQTSSKSVSSASSNVVSSKPATTSNPATSTPSKTETVSSQAPVSSAAQTSSKPVSSTPNNTTSSKPATSTPATSGGNTGTSTKWVCPDPSAHPQESVSGCLNQYCHDSYVAMYKEQEANKNKTPADPNKCWICGRPFGDGYNGTCLNYFCDGSYKCHHYDTGETCQIKHGV